MTMTYRMIEDYTLNFTGGPMTPKGFAIHWWGDPAQKPTFDAILRVLIQAAEVRRASVNFMAEAGKVACLVSPFTVAWGQGDGATGWGNNNLVSIECNPRCTAADRETVAELIADQHIRNGIPIVLYPHNKFTATQCPGVWEQYLPWLTARAKQIVTEKTKAPVVAPKPAPKPAPVKKAAPKPATQGNGSGPGFCIVERGDTLSGIAKQFNKPLSTIVGLNPGINPNRIVPGQKIYLLNHCFVDPGDTMSSIAKQYGMSLDRLAKMNPGININRIVPGQVIWLQ